MNVLSTENLHRVVKNYHWDDLDKQLSAKPYSDFSTPELGAIWAEVGKRFSEIPIGDRVILKDELTLKIPD